jgi:hypothetical protein
MGKYNGPIAGVGDGRSEVKEEASRSKEGCDEEF